jgi:hypothetical protein
MAALPKIMSDAAAIRAKAVILNPMSKSPVG